VGSEQENKNLEIHLDNSFTTNRSLTFRICVANSQELEFFSSFSCMSFSEFNGVMFL
jgi:hypothetical protein